MVKADMILSPSRQQKDGSKSAECLYDSKGLDNKMTGEMVCREVKQMNRAPNFYK